MKKLTENYTKIDNRLLDYYIRYLGADGAILYLIYCRLYNDAFGYAYPSIRNLSAATGFSTNKIIKLNKELVKKKVLKIEPGKGRVNRYKPENLWIDEGLLKWIEEDGGKPLVKSVRLKKDSENGVSVPVAEEHLNGKCSYSGGVSVPVAGKQTITKDKDRKEQQQRGAIEPDDQLLPHESQTNGDVVVFIQNMEKDYECFTGKKPGSLIVHLVKQYGIDYVSEKLDLLYSQSNISNAGAWLRAACKRNYEAYVPASNNSNKIQELEHEIKRLEKNLKAAQEKPVDDFHVEPGRDMPKTKEGVKEWTINNLQDQIWRRKRALEDIKLLDS